MIKFIKNSIMVVLCIFLTAVPLWLVFYSKDLMASPVYHSDYMQCGRKSVEVGDSLAKVYEYCGHAKYERNFEDGVYMIYKRGSKWYTLNILNHTINSITWGINR